MKLESAQRKLSSRIDSKTEAIVADTASEFENLRAQFEVYGESLYSRLSVEFNGTLEQTLKRFGADLSSSMRRDSTGILMEGVRDFERKVMVLEGMMEDLKITQDAAVDELSRFEIKLEMRVDRQLEEFSKRLDGMGKTQSHKLLPQDPSSKVIE